MTFLIWSRTMFNRFRNHISNFTAFTALQAAAQLIPIITIPYFVRVLGIDGMGVLAITTAAGLSASVLMDYAIQLSGTRFAASHAEDRDAISSYFNVSSFTKLIILMPIMLILTFLSVVLQSVGEHFWVFFWSLLAAATLCLFPQWLFQGLLAMPTAARILVTSRIVSVLLAALLVRGPKDVYIIPMTQAICGAGALVLVASVLSKKFQITLKMPCQSSIAKLLKENWSLFSATFWGAVYSHGAIIIMSTMLSHSAIGLFSIGQKISQAIVAMFNVSAQTAFPLFVRSRTSKNFRQQVLYYMFGVILAAGSSLIAIWIIRRPVYEFFAAQNSSVGVGIFEIWLAASFFTIISVSLNPIMVTLRFDGPMARVYRLLGLAFIGVAPLACAFAGGVGMAVTILITELLMAGFCAVSVLVTLGKIARHHGS